MYKVKDHLENYICSFKSLCKITLEELGLNCDVDKEVLVFLVCKNPGPELSYLSESRDLTTVTIPSGVWRGNERLLNDIVKSECFEDVLNLNDKRTEKFFFKVGSQSLSFGTSTVWPVIGIPKQLWKQDCLKNAKGETNKVLYGGKIETENFPLINSLLESVVLRLLENAENEIYSMTKTQRRVPVTYTDILRRSASIFMNQVGFRFSSEIKFGLVNFFRLCNKISEEYHENEEARGSIYITKEKHFALEEKLRFSEPIVDLTSLRKLIQLSSTDKKIGLHFDGGRLFGLSKVVNEDINKDDIFEVRITGYRKWEFHCIGRTKPLFVVEKECPVLPLVLDEKNIKEHISEIFHVNEQNLKGMVKLIQLAKKEKHGTMLIFSNNAESEANRLKASGRSISPLNLINDTSLLSCLTPIDGALILSPEGVCYSIATILDGKATNGENSNRGARYNSAVRYINLRKKKGDFCLAVVISEDGHVNYIPEKI